MKEEDIKIEEESFDDTQDKNIESKIKKIKDKLKKCQKEKEEYLNGWQRAKADFINARKEEEKKREEFIKFSNQMLMTDILPVLDSFELAIENSKDKGFTLIRSQLSDVLEKYGIEEIKSEQEKFNPNLHEVIEEVESEQESGIIIESVQKGYKLNNKTLRPAKVKISK